MEDGNNLGCLGQMRLGLRLQIGEETDRKRIKPRWRFVEEFLKCHLMGSFSEWFGLASVCGRGSG